jgi:hypothetical protein
MAKYKTALGKTVDMGALSAKNEKTRAVGNLKVNARGDTIDSMGRVITPATSKVNMRYSKTVGNRSSHATKSAPENTRPVADIVPESEELTEFERDLNSEEDDALLVEKIKAAETKSETKVKK